MNKNDQALIDEVAAWRKERNLSWSEFARLVGRHPRFLRRVLKGEVGMADGTRNRLRLAAVEHERARMNAIVEKDAAQGSPPEPRSAPRKRKRQKVQRDIKPQNFDAAAISVLEHVRQTGDTSLLDSAILLLSAS